MLERYFHRPVTADRIRALSLGPQIDHRALPATRAHRPAFHSTGNTREPAR